MCRITICENAKACWINVNKLRFILSVTLYTSLASCIVSILLTADVQEVIRECTEEYNKYTSIAVTLTKVIILTER